ncbi:MAG: bis(5'-nucleosyl)-tetraphosphatase (symmetrical) [Legionellales bacterium RIFCSPHIGHO2_12_FULL_35_11]|nr:MAG: bis(5'-nucleosyl)-tetraphosphatase (symmetrical) [Legionellales bacterium RIFCSPHIGHO2_12_FULL_35_11]
MSQICNINQHTRYDYAIGDIQGCFDGLRRLLDKIDYDEKLDKLWLVGDLVNRGPHSLEVLRFIKNLPIKPIITLGNHDLYLVSMIFSKKKSLAKKDTLKNILKATDAEDIGHWLRQQNILYHCPNFNIAISHAGIPPIWSLEQAKLYAKELESFLAGNNFLDFLDNMMGDTPSKWSESLNELDRLRLICNYFTRMRFCDANDGHLILNHKGGIENVPLGIAPWFSVKNRIPINAEIIFGHWAALEGKNPSSTIHAIDTGFVWGGAMTALRLQDKIRISVNWH